MRPIQIPQINDYGMFILNNGKSFSQQQYVLNAYYIIPKYKFTLRQYLQSQCLPEQVFDVFI